ncbi:MAG: PDZ domain-containing protein, partial [Planctomycetota bacterium]
MSHSKFRGTKQKSRTILHWAMAVSVTFATVFGFANQLQAELTGPDTTHRNVTIIVSKLMLQEHLSKRPIDDQISGRALTSYVEMLDPMKIYFQKSDIEEFKRFNSKIDDFVKRGDTRVSFTIFKRFLERVDQRSAEIDALINTDHDFTADEELIIDPDHFEYAASDAEARELWRKRIKYELLFRKADDMTYDEAKEKVARRYKSIAKRKHQIDSNELLEMFLTSVTSSFDPHTTYMSPDSHTNFEINMRLNLDGIGAALKPDDGYTVVTKIIPGGAADKAGELKPEDRIVSVGQGVEGDMVDVVDMKLSDVVKMIRGQAGTVVRLGVIPDGTTKTNVIKITRARIELKDSEARGD